MFVYHLQQQRTYLSAQAHHITITCTSHALHHMHTGTTSHAHRHITCTRTTSHAHITCTTSHAHTHHITCTTHTHTHTHTNTHLRQGDECCEDSREGLSTRQRQIWGEVGRERGPSAKDHTKSASTKLPLTLCTTP